MAIRVSRRGPVLLIAIDRPSKKNAIDAEHADAIARAADQLDSDGSLFLAILTGTQDCFCSGADIRARLAGEKVTGQLGFAGFTHRDRDKPVIAAVEGVAYGGGLEMALACDLIVAGRSASFALPETRLSVLAAAGGAYRLSWAIPPKIALEMSITGRPISGERGYELGLVNRVAADRGALEAAWELADEILACAPLAVRAARRVQLRSQTLDDSAARELAGREYRDLMKTADFREGPAAFAAKRHPAWRGE